MDSILKAKSLTAGYDKKSVVSGIDIDALKGQVICLLGPNGAGKSTILRTLSGLLAPVSGTVEICGADISERNSRERAKNLSVVLTAQNVPSLLTAFEVAAMGRTPYTDFLGRLTDEDSEIVTAALETTGAADLSDRYFSELSDGEKQKVMIARALAQQPRLIILDEPTSHLDIKHKIEVMRVINRLSNEKGITCILSLHDIDLALKCCRTVMLVSGGRIAACGSPEEVASEGTINSLYGITGASYNELSGSVELKAPDRNDVFLLCGAGSGRGIMRSLVRSGKGVSAGVLHQGDADYEAAVGICGKVVSEKAFQPITAENAAEAYRLMSECEYVADSGFPVGEINSANPELLKKAALSGKNVLSLRNPDEAAEIFGEAAEKMQFFKKLSELTAHITGNKG
ncbi:MAG: ABC transporter ATP-binding protein [Ruminiclostridium sp.]